MTLQCMRLIFSNASFFSNLPLFCSAAQQAPYKRTYLPIVESTDETDEWYYHPTMQVKVNEAGTHVYDIKNECFIKIRRYEWKTSDWKVHRAKIRKKEMLYDRVALECFIGRVLRKGETVEHIDCDRDNNHKSNLIPRYRLFQANARKVHKLKVDGKHTGVYKRADGRGWFACVRLYTPDGCVASVEVRKYFWLTQYGTSEKAEEAAVAFRRKHCLQEGMIWV